jgi:hypothetical protein
MFRVNIVNRRTGEPDSNLLLQVKQKVVNAGGSVKLPNASVVWLTKEN